MSDFYSDQNGNGLRTTGPLGGQISSPDPAIGTLGEQSCAGVNHHDNIFTAEEKVRQYRENQTARRLDGTYSPSIETINLPSKTLLYIGIAFTIIFSLCSAALGSGSEVIKTIGLAVFGAFIGGIFFVLPPWCFYKKNQNKYELQQSRLSNKK
jgi:hypothetical protein